MGLRIIESFHYYECEIVKYHRGAKACGILDSESWPRGGIHYSTLVCN